ncbi:Uncharacterized iron-regulated membrane protein [bacterium A37T11]|nr:Uncharacterized iron-regulated membrane protein [bacterium A37T11]
MTLRKKLPAKKYSRSLFYRISAWLHLWLGLVTGIIVVIVCLTGCIWMFNEEITNLLEPKTRVKHRDQAVLTPSQLQEVVKKNYPGKHPTYASYRMGSAIYVGVTSGEKKPPGKKVGRRGGEISLRINPYSGQIVKVTETKEGQTDFFRFILNGHRFLWLPYEIGRPIVNYSILIFIITLITGMVLWWPKKWNKSTRDKSFKVKWDGSPKRVNYDLHNVFGFYTLLILFAVATTGIVYGIQWFSKSLYWVSTGGQTLPAFERSESDSLQVNKHYSLSQAMDLAWNKVLHKHPDAQGFYYSFPEADDVKSTIGIYIYPSAGKNFNNRNYVFDQHTLKPLKGYALSSKDFSESNFGEKLRRMNYDIHIGSILGLTGRCIVFFATLIGASLPITGFIIWWGKRKKRPKSINKQTNRIQHLRPGEFNRWPQPVK